MRSMVQHRDPVRLMWRRVLLVILIGVLAATLGAVWSVYGKRQESAQLRAQAESRLQDLQARNDALSAAIQTLDSDRGQEEVLRDTYDVGRPGEGLIVIVDQKATTSEDQRTAGKRPWWRFW